MIYSFEDEVHDLIEDGLEYNACRRMMTKIGMEMESSKRRAEMK